ncbi:MAG TPA: hypothetical protein VMZ73_01550 [Acidimicrobiales bacterium]|nr:hypothetical protein [Acidimicrobiales bacterium]
MTDTDTLAAVERWFRSRGIPHFIDQYSASRDVFTRVLAPLTAILMLELVTALDASWPWWFNLGVAAASLGAVVVVWAAVNLARKRRALARPNRVGSTELAIFVLLVPVLDLLAGGQRLTALNTMLVNLALLGLIYLGTSYALLPITRWAAGRLWRQLADVLGLLVRALPLLLLFVTFLFLTTEVWQVAASLDGPFLAVTMGLFVVVGTVFVVARIPLEVGALARFESWSDVAVLVGGTPAAGLDPPAGASPAGTPRLGRRQWGNVGLVVLFTQGLQIVFVSVMIGVFFVGFGLLTVTPQLTTTWVGSDAHLLLDGILWGRPVAVTSELLQVAGFLTAFSGFYFTVYVLTDATYRKEFLEEVLVELRQAFAVRAVYLASRRA